MRLSGKTFTAQTRESAGARRAAVALARALASLPNSEDEAVFYRRLLHISPNFITPRTTQVGRLAELCHGAVTATTDEAPWDRILVVAAAKASTVTELAGIASLPLLTASESATSEGQAQPAAPTDDVRGAGFGSTPVWRRAPVAGMDLEAPPPAVQAPQPMDVEALAPSPVAQAQPPASPGVVAPRAPDDVAWGFDTPVWSVEAKFTSNPKQHILIGHYLEDEPNLTLLDRMGEVHGLVVVAETADEKFALVCATPKIASGIRSGKFWAAMQGEDCFFVTVKSDARRLYERRSRPHTRFPSRRRR